MLGESAVQNYGSHVSFFTILLLAALSDCVSVCSSSELYLKRTCARISRRVFGVAVVFVLLLLFTLLFLLLLLLW